MKKITYETQEKADLAVMKSKDYFYLTQKPMAELPVELNGYHILYEDLSTGTIIYKIDGDHPVLPESFTWNSNIFGIHNNEGNKDNLLSLVNQMAKDQSGVHPHHLTSGFSVDVNDPDSILKAMYIALISGNSVVIMGLTPTPFARPDNAAFAVEPSSGEFLVDENGERKIISAEPFSEVTGTEEILKSNLQIPIEF